ncbi:hypothetical protein T484DRAFT_1818887, partial [Baffinella frigidus]
RGHTARAAGDGGVTRRELQGMVRASLSNVLVWTRVEMGRDLVTQVILVGSRTQPRFVFNSETYAVLFDHRKQALSEGKAITAECSPVASIVWCSDSELLLITTALEPFITSTSDSTSGSGDATVSGGRIALEHATLRAMAVYRYDNPGSVAVVTRPKTGHDLALLAVRPEEADEKSDKTAKDKNKKVAGDASVLITRMDGDFAAFREEP